VPKRRSHFIRREQATNSLPAILTAFEIGYPLNTFITVNFGHLGYSGENADLLNTRLKKWVQDWLRRPKKKMRFKSTPLTMMWVIENHNHVGVHWALHLPYGAKKHFTLEFEYFLKREFGDLVNDKTLKIKRVSRILGLRKYMLKGLQDIYGPLYRINTSNQGLVVGKRFGFTQNIGPSQIKSLNIKERRSFLISKYFPELSKS